MLRGVCFIFVLFLITIETFGQNIEIYKQGPIHEAFITQEFGQTLLEQILSSPPDPIEEEVPQNFNEDYIWIQGYFAWSREKNYVWVSGIWRRPPPGKTWIAGKWEKIEGDNWVRLPGFWTEDAENIEITRDVPPEPIDETVSTPAYSNLFWAPGFWRYNEKIKKFVWHSGRFETFDKDSVYSPGHYIWRPEGYIFVPPYWDWPLEKRGIVFASIIPDPNNKEIYTPEFALSESLIIRNLYPSYPYYNCFFDHHYYFHRDQWLSWNAAPPWWHCPSWWSFTWFDQYWLWWWWTHPGYPQPTWLSKEEIKRMPPPMPCIVKFMEKALPPPIITPNGGISPQILIDAGRKVQAFGNKPLLPSDPKRLQEIQELAYPKPFSPILQPGGEAYLSEEDLKKPCYGPSKSQLESFPGRTHIPPKPEMNLEKKEEDEPKDVRITPRPRPPVRRETSLVSPYRSRQEPAGYPSLESSCNNNTSGCAGSCDRGNNRCSSTDWQRDYFRGNNCRSGGCGSSGFGDEVFLLDRHSVNTRSLQPTPAWGPASAGPMPLIPPIVPPPGHERVCPCPEPEVGTPSGAPIPPGIGSKPGGYGPSPFAPTGAGTYGIRHGSYPSPSDMPYQGEARPMFIPPIPLAQQNLSDYMGQSMPQQNQGPSSQYTENLFEPYIAP